MAPSGRKRSKAAAAAAAGRQWKVGDLVLAKVKGFQAWPAMVSEPEKWGYAVDWKKILVCFFGTQQIAFCNPVDVEAFTEEKKQSLLRKRHGKYSDFGRAVSEIIDTFEKLKKEDEVNNSSDDTYEDPMVSENNTAEVLTESVSSDKSPLITSRSCQGKTVTSGTQIDVIIKSGIDFDDANSNEGLSEREVPSKDVRFGINVAEGNFISTYSTRRRSERSQASKSSISRQPPFRPSRSSRVDDIEVDSSDVVSNCTSAEGNDSGILTVDSAAFFCKDGSDAEWDSKPVQPVVVTDLDQPNNELGQRLDFQTTTIIHKKKRKPKRKRPSNESLEYTFKVDTEKVSDIGVIRNGTILSSEHEKSHERYLREDSDAHLPFLKRAKVRMSQALSIGDEPNSSHSSEEKQLEVSRSISDQVWWSLHGEIDGSADKEALHCGRDSDTSPPPYKEPEIPSVQEVKTTVASGSSMDVEAVLPPSKRLHRALEAMSANAAQDDEISVAGSNVNCTSFSGDLCNLMEIRTNSSLKLGNDEELYKNKSPDGPFESPSRSKTYQNVGDSSGLESPINRDHSLNSSFTEIKDAAVVECSKSLSPNVFIKVRNISCGTGPPCGPMSCDDGCMTMTTMLIEPLIKPDPESCQLAFNVISGTNVRVQSPYNDSCGTTKSCKMTIENFKDPSKLKCEDNVVESEPTERRSEPSTSPVLQIELNGEDQSHSGNINGHLARSTFLSDDHSLEKVVSVNQSSSSLTDGLDPISHATPHTLAGNTSTSDNVSVLLNGSCSSGVRCFTVENGATNWNCKEAQVNLSAFEAILGTLTRTKECIGRATRLAMDCAKYGVASTVVEIIARNLEKEPSMHRRVDLFFLVDSIAQFSNGLKGDIGGVYPSAICAVLPRLLSAAAPPGIGSQENRRQCLKVLRVWLERLILPETTIRNHIRELDSFGSASCSRASRRSYRNERAFDDPVREMEGMLVDEYGSNSCFQLPGFCMPPMLRDEDGEVDSDGESFEAVTPEHDVEKSEVEKVQAPAMERHTHILKDIDGELEMEDVAPTEDFASGSNVCGMNGAVASNFPKVNSVSFVVAPPLPEDLQPASLPLPPPPSEKTDYITKSFKTCSQVPNKKPEPAKCSPFRNRYIPLPHNKNSQAEGFDKGFRLPPPHPAPSNQFSYLHNQRSKSRRDIPHSSNSNGSHMPNTGNRNFYRDNDRIRFAPRGFQERWRGPQHFPDYHDGSRISYPPPHFGAQHCDPSLPKHRWGFPYRPVSHQGYMRHRPSSAGTDFWRPR